MSKFKENDEVWIETGDLGVVKSVGAVRGVGAVYSVETYNGYKILVRESDLSFQDLMMEPIEEYEESSFSVDDYFSEMASIAYYKGLNIAYNDETDRLGIAYFKVYDHDKIRSAKRVARLRFKDSEMEYHKDTIGKQPWILNSRDIKNIINLLIGTNKTNPEYSNWQVLCFKWNYDNNFIPMEATINEMYGKETSSRKQEIDRQHINPCVRHLLGTGDICFF